MGLPFDKIKPGDTSIEQGVPSKIPRTLQGFFNFYYSKNFSSPAHLCIKFQDIQGYIGRLCINFFKCLCAYAGVRGPRYFVACPTRVIYLIFFL